MTLRSGVRAVVFDLDGTLIDSRADIVGAVEFTLERHGRPLVPASEITSYVGDGARALLSRVWKTDPSDRAMDPVLETFLTYYSVHGADRTTLVDGADVMLGALAHLPLALATNKPRAATDLVLERLGLSRWLRVVVAGDDLPQKKPDPAVLAHIAGKLKVPIESLVMVGDGPQDVECGKRAAARTVGVVGPFVTEERLRATAPDVLVHSLRDVPATIAAFE